MHWFVDSVVIFLVFVVNFVLLYGLICLLFVFVLLLFIALWVFWIVMYCYVVGFALYVDLVCCIWFRVVGLDLNCFELVSSLVLVGFEVLLFVIYACLPILVFGICLGCLIIYRFAYWFVVFAVVFLVGCVFWFGCCFVGVCWLFVGFGCGWLTGDCVADCCVCVFGCIWLLACGVARLLFVSVICFPFCLS